MISFSPLKISQHSSTGKIPPLPLPSLHLHLLCLGLFSILQSYTCWLFLSFSFMTLFLLPFLHSFWASFVVYSPYSSSHLTLPPHLTHTHTLPLPLPPPKHTHTHMINHRGHLEETITISPTQTALALQHLCWSRNSAETGRILGKKIHNIISHIQKISFGRENFFLKNHKSRVLFWL